LFKYILGFFRINPELPHLEKIEENFASRGTSPFNTPRTVCLLNNIMLLVRPPNTFIDA